MMIDVYPESRIGGGPEILAIQQRFRRAEDAGDALAMAKCLSDELHIRASFTPSVDERTQYLAARAELHRTVPQSASRSMAKSLGRASVPAVQRRAPSPELEMAELRRDLSVAGSLLMAKKRFAKCIASGDVTGSINAMNCRLSAHSSLAKSQSDRDRYTAAKQQLCIVAHAAGLHLANDGSYVRPMAKALPNTSTANAKAFDQMFATLTQLMGSAQITAAIRAEVERLRNEVVSRALSYGCRLKNGKFVPYAC